MSKITIVGMGPGSSSHLTLEAFDCLTSGELVYIRTSNHPVVKYLARKGMKFQAMDEFYESSESFEETYSSIAGRILAEADVKDVIYAVPGNPFVAEKTVQLILSEAESRNHVVHVIHGVSFIDAMITSLQYDPVHGFDIQDALTATPEVVLPRVDQLWIQVYSPAIASQLKVLLMNSYDDEEEVIVVQAAGIPELERIEKLKLYELDHHPDLFNHLTSVFVPKASQRKKDIYDLTRIMNMLLSEKGCPWDKEQTHLSLTPYLIEEAYEVKEAVENEDDEALVDELGDVLLQVVFHCALGEQEGYFELSDVFEAICSKMIRRHPHVFSDVLVENSEEVLQNWQVIKDQEKRHESVTESMKGVSKSLPALLRATKVQKKASDVGFDWKSALDAIDKIHEELNEFKEALLKGDNQHAFEEMGDLLLIVSNVARLHKINPEEALYQATIKFIDRFEYIETEMTRVNKALGVENLDVMEELWLESKNKNKS